MAKVEVRSWPLFGLLARLQRTVFVERKASRIAEHRDEMIRRLEIGDNLILFPEGTSNDGVLIESGRQTTIKNRFVAGSQQLLRADQETPILPSDAAQKKLLNDIGEALSSANILLLSDYGKGMLAGEIAERILTLAEKAGVPVLVDPKGFDQRIVFSHAVLHREAHAGEDVDAMCHRKGENNNRSNLGRRHQDRTCPPSSTEGDKNGHNNHQKGRNCAPDSASGDTYDNEYQKKH